MLTRRVLAVTKQVEELCYECKHHVSYHRTESKEIMLHFAVSKNHNNCVDVLLEIGADVNWVDDSVFTPLMIAAQNGFVDGVQKLIQAGADVNRRSKKNETALIAAAFEGHNKCIDLLLNAGADVNVMTSGRYKHFTALHAAVESKNVKCLELLLKTGADVNKTGREFLEVTALSLASRKGLDEAVKLLIEAGASVNRLTKHGDPPLVEALDFHYYDDSFTDKHLKCVELLLEAGADVNVEWDDSYTILRVASAFCFYEAVDLLLRAGADVNKAV